MRTEETVKKRKLESQRINDIDLVELAGFHAYKMDKGLNLIIVNGNEFEVMDMISEPKTGLDAFTVQNTITKDYTVVYVGTDPKSVPDIKTDLKLPRLVDSKSILFVNTFPRLNILTSYYVLLPALV